jgi:hypothetical protein
MTFSDIEDSLREGSVFRAILSSENSFLTYVYFNNSIKGYGDSFDSVLDSMIFTEDNCTLLNGNSHKELTKKLVEKRANFFFGDLNFFDLDAMRPDLWLKKGRMIEGSYSNGKFIAKLFEPSKKEIQLSPDDFCLNNNGYSVEVGKGTYLWGAVTNAFVNFKNNWGNYIFHNIEPKKQSILEADLVKPNLFSIEHHFADEGVHSKSYRFKFNSKHASLF